jgi:hypothetical protein
MKPGVSDGVRRRARRISAFAGLGLSWLALGTCVPRQAERDGSRATAGAADQVAAAATGGDRAAPRCPTRQAARTFVGFADDVEPVEFEPAALEAESILRSVKQQLCALTDVEDRRGRLRAAVAAGPFEITEVLFVRANLSRARVRVQPATDVAVATGTGGAPPAWLLDVANDASGWRITASALQ